MGSAVWMEGGGVVYAPTSYCVDIHPHMGARSAEAIARRAEKRGRTVDEQKKADRESDARRSQAAAAASESGSDRKGKAAPPPPTTASDATKSVPAVAAGRTAAAVTVGTPVWKLDEKPGAGGKLKKDAKGGWMCNGLPGQVCGFINFAYRETCKQCEARRLLPAAGSGGGGGGGKSPKKRPRDAGGADAAAGGHTATATRPAAGVGGGGGQKKGEGRGGGAAAEGSGTAWEGSNLPGAAEANAALRQQYLADPSQLSDADRARAEALISRSERKRADKDARRAARQHAGLAGRGGGGRRGGGQHGAAGGGGRGVGRGKGGGGGGGTSSTSTMSLSSERGPPPSKRPRKE